MTFSEAFTFIREHEDPDAGMRLPHWSSEVVVKVQVPDAGSKMTHPYLYVESRLGVVPWKETVVELFSDDWEVIE